MAERKAPVWWGIPKRFSERGRERKISWLELFYDLVYAAAISQLTEHLANHANVHGLAYVLFLFTFLYWSWLNGSLYHDLHGNSGVRSRLTTLWQMMAIAAVAVTIPNAFAGHHQGFAISFAVVQLVITYLWWSTGYYEEGHKLLNKYYVRMYSLGLVLMVASVFVPYHIALGLWVLALVSNLSAAIFSAGLVKEQTLIRGETFSTSDSMIERFGLFTMIVLGEAILGIIHGITGAGDATFVTWLCFILCILIAFLLWWIYFDTLGESSAQTGYTKLLVIAFGYLPLLASFAIVGATIRIMLADTGANTPARPMFGAAVAVILLCITGIACCMKQDAAEEKAIDKILRLMLFTALLVLLVTALCTHCSLPIYLGLIVIALLTAIVFGFRVWLGYGLFTEE